ncbi:FliA/WhiG family RNA polymerase sigma factor [Deferribacter autotrophicus]|uniref:FliA/WhiG family RNA polymerase sigma factor n=1 Tax=Deferribacter autotrophicus TaxID=500465 RepID=A0A5A8F3Q1_9BACT|nr:FliA/WhiG family RNA polymerase sigma factor [Deferribacter autotrophicus]KAA0257114.1 FliA/WhiG family RNA polymerase sigma factor [Deferribacter autotrophicus]
MSSYYKLNNNYLNQEELINEFIPKIKSWVIRAVNTLPDSVDVDEIYSAACYGFVEALNRYDKSKGVDFKAYAERRIKGAILDCLRSLDHLSRGMRSKVKDLEEKIAKLSTKLGRKPTVEEMVKEYNMEEDEVNKLLELIENSDKTSLDTVVGDDENSSLVDFIKSDILTPEENIEKRELINILAREIESLKEKERLVITLYYYEELTMKEIGEVLGISESRVCQIHNSVVDKLKRRLRKYYE